MQTFLPYADFARSAACLDDRRLGKQRVEAKQILRALYDSNYGWQNHPAVRMWRRHEFELCGYGLAICAEWRKRGFKDSVEMFFHKTMLEVAHIDPEGPSWLGDERLHSSHRAALLWKRPSFYLKFRWPETPRYSYWWPTQETE